MKKISKSEAGFGTVEVVLMLVIAGLIGVAGFMVYKNHNNAPNNTATTTTPTPTPTTATKPAVAITEWGVKVEFDDADKVTYKMSTDDSGKQHADLFLKNSVAMVCQALGVDFSRDTTTSSSDNSNKVGTYYYQLGGGPGACSDDPGGTNGSINQLRSKIDAQELGSGNYTVSAL